MLQLQRNVPPPPRRAAARHGNTKYPFEKMTKVGDFFFVANKRRDSIRSYFSSAGAARGIKLRSEQIHAREGDDGWEPCPEDAPGAVSGVGVWRVE